MILNNQVVLYEDADLLVVNKPTGIVTNDAETHQTESLQNWVKARLETEYGQPLETLSWDTVVPTWREQVPSEFDTEFGTPEAVFADRFGMVHRLDKDTSGVVIFAKHPGSLVQLLMQFKERLTQKTYVCLTHGHFGIAADTVSFPIGRASRDRKLFSVRADGREAVTTYQVREFFPGLNQEALFAHLAGSHPEYTEQNIKELKRRLKIYQGFSLVACQPKTGRTHQIRVHMAHLQHPLVGDTTYVGRKRQALDPLWCPRQFLHAEQLSLTHPRDGRSLIFQAALPADLSCVMQFLTPEIPQGSSVDV